jgi:hypothetical protein
MSLKEAINQIREDVGRIALTEVTDSELRAGLANPDIRPNSFDGTLEAWLFRIDRWGKVNYTYFEPGSKRGKNVSRREFLKAFTNDDLLRAFGKWRNEVLNVNELMWFREFIGIDGKKQVEKFLIKVDLKPEYRDAIK